MQFQADYSLRPHNSFGFDARARFWAQAESVEDINEGIAFARHRALPLMVLGEGSNVVIASDYPGLVLNIAIPGKVVVAEDQEHVWVSIGAGENWHQLVLWCLDNHYYGIENLVLIPGAVGAAPIQNIGAYGVELKSCFDRLQALSRETGELREFTGNDCRFGYRDSIFKRSLKDRYIITQVTLRLNKTPNLDIGYGEIEAELSRLGATATPVTVAEAVTRIRTRKLPDPTKLGNAGSFFKNPIITKAAFEKLQQKYPDIVGYPIAAEVKLAAAWLVDRCGWKGFREGDAGVHDEQALVLVNHGSSQGEQILALAEKISTSVRQRFDVELELEPRVY